LKLGSVIPPIFKKNALSILDLLHFHIYILDYKNKKKRLVGFERDHSEFIDQFGEKAILKVLIITIHEYVMLLYLFRLPLISSAMIYNFQCIRLVLLFFNFILSIFFFFDYLVNGIINLLLGIA
jgi:hypothetical protein